MLRFSTLSFTHHKHHACHIVYTQHGTLFCNWLLSSLVALNKFSVICICIATFVLSYKFLIVVEVCATRYGNRQDRVWQICDVDWKKIKSHSTFFCNERSQNKSHLYFAVNSTFLTFDRSTCDFKELIQHSIGKQFLNINNITLTITISLSLI